MLVLTRKVDESIIIGDEIDIKILALSGSQVKIGISAPRSLRILRKEVHDQVKKDGGEAPVTEAPATEAGAPPTAAKNPGDGAPSTPSA